MRYQVWISVSLHARELAYRQSMRRKRCYAWSRSCQAHRHPCRRRLVAHRDKESEERVCAISALSMSSTADLNTSIVAAWRGARRTTCSCDPEVDELLTQVDIVLRTLRLDWDRRFAGEVE